MSAPSQGRPVLRLVPITDPTASTDTRWREDAACAGLDTERFFPVDDRAASVETPRRVCRGCPVRAACLTDVLATEDPARRYGITGGTTPGERRVLHRAGLTLSVSTVGGDVA
ncbi:WhiB family transcriptional regulator [Pseudonocardia sp. EV170527-09]|uniref:WhiB family transcriptional regulator n=1 Tax=Pseudonocardia sp. EV170527-09 TaxID=2603411 RepID=UPI0011F1F2E2|nr:WhiB family transcriptional regulator [Pseudonocardia sp. EV170527-09]KAA1009642.1 WhiB family transcriptional regulator [Pseudonocardia sp. EV170527-09]